MTPSEALADMRCPLLVLTHDYGDDDVPTLVIASCEQPLYLIVEQFTDLEDTTVTGSHWTIRCGAGHVPVVPDFDDEDDPPINLELVATALAHTHAEAP